MEKKERLFSLDVLRGMDMFLLSVVYYVLRGAQKSWDCFSPGFMRQISHAWGGFTFWDIIMPLFIFMCGAAMPFALERRMEDGRAGWTFWKHVLGRVVLLWILGMVVQGRLLTLDPMKISLYNNTLQTIAMGYLITAFAIAAPSRTFRIALPFVLAFVYAALLAFGGDYSENGNFAMKVEMKICALTSPEGSWARCTNGYTWYLTSLMFGAMTLTGYHVTQIFRSAHPPMRKFLLVLSLGVLLLAFGWAVTPWIPMIKHIFTLSFTAQAMGWCTIALALLYGLTDILKFRRGMGIFILFGQFSLLAYMLCAFHETIDAFDKTVFGGLELWLGAAAMPFVMAVASGAVKTTVLILRRKFRHCGKGAA